MGNAAEEFRPVSRAWGWCFYGCKNEKALTSPFAGEAFRRIVRAAGFEVFATAFKKFSGGGEGYTVSVIIGESSADAHTWPEAGTVHVRLFFCDFTQENGPKKDIFLEMMKQWYRPVQVVLVNQSEYPVYPLP